MKKFLILALLFPMFSFALTEKVVVTGMDRPWAIVAGPDGNYWVSQKFAGDILIFNTKFERVNRIKGFTQFEGYVEGGLMDIAFHPQFSQKPWVYVVYTVATASGHRARLARFTYQNGKMQDLKTLFQGPDSKAGNHFGSRLLFDDSGHILVSFGERTEKEKAQHLNEMNGKIVRLTDDGVPAKDNPFPQGIHSYGHRNPQGLAMHPVTRRIYDSDHGPSNYDAPPGGDEINLIEMGKNYGWPKIHHRETAKDMVSPILEFTPSVAPSGIAFYTGSALAKWKNDLFVACLVGRQLQRIRLDSDGKVKENEALLQGKYGRLRDVENGFDGSLLVLAEDGRIIQLTD